MIGRAPPLSLRLVASAAFVLCAMAALGCEPRIVVDLLDVTSVESERIDAGHRLSVAGHRFLLGHACTFVLRGVWHRPGVAAVRGEHTIPAEASSGELAEAIVTEEVVRALGGRTTFVGDLEVRFDAASIPGGIVRGTLRGVTLDFVPAVRTAGRAELAALERSLGVRFAEPGDDPGVEVAEVEPGGLFSSLGVEPGDRVVSRGALRILWPGDLDLAAVPPTERVFGVTRGGSTLELRAADLGAPATLAPVRAHQLAALLALLGLALGLLTRPRPERRDAVRLAGPAHLVVSVVVALGLEQAIARGLLDDVSALVGAGVLAIALSGATSASRDGTSALVTCVRALAFAAVVLAAAALAGTTDLGALSERAGGDPACWPGLGSALGPAAAVALVVACARPSHDVPSPTQGALDALALGLVSATATAVLYGGVAGADAASSLLFVVRASIIATGIAVARSELGALGRRPFVVFGVGSVIFSGGSLYLALVAPLDATSARALAETLALSLVLLLTLALVARARPLPSIARELEL